MTDRPILLIGGSGSVGRWTARYLREAHPELPLLIGGRDVAKANGVARELGHAEGVAVDLAAADLGLGKRDVGAVVLLVKDERLSALRFAQDHGVPHVGISSASFEMAPEISYFMRRPHAAPIVFGGEWLAGAAVLPVLALSKKLARLDEVRIDVLLDEQDAGGPAAQSDLKEIAEVAPAALTRRDGKFFWRAGDAAKVVFRALDGTEIQGTGSSPFDIGALAAATDAPNLALNIGVGVSSSRRRGEPMSHEILITLRGLTQGGEPFHQRHAVVHPGGEAPLTALGVTMMVERAAGLDRADAPRPGLYYPEHLIDPDAYLHRLAAIGGVVTALPAPMS